MLRGGWDSRNTALVPDPVYAFLDGWLLAVAGDTAAAIGTLDILLGRLGGVRHTAFRHPADVAAIVRAMALRAELAAAVGDVRTAARWAEVVFALWQYADPPVRASVSHLEGMIQRVDR